MKVKHYNEMMAYLTRPGFNSGGSVNFNGGGSVRNKTVLPKRKPKAEIKRRQKINYEKIKQYLGEESQEFIERELGFAVGGRVNPAQLKQRFMQLVASIQDAEAEEIPGIIAQAKQIKDQIDEINLTLSPDRQIKITSQGLDFDNPLLDAAKIAQTVGTTQEVTGGLTKDIVPETLKKDNPALKGIVPDFPKGTKGTLADPEEKEDLKIDRRVGVTPDRKFMQASMKNRQTEKNIMDYFRRAPSDPTETEGSFAEGGRIDFKIGGQVIIDTYNQSKTDLGRNPSVEELRDAVQKVEEKGRRPTLDRVRKVLGEANLELFEPRGGLKKAILQAHTDLTKELGKPPTTRQIDELTKNLSKQESAVQRSSVISEYLNEAGKKFTVSDAGRTPEARAKAAATLKAKDKPRLGQPRKTPEDKLERERYKRMEDAKRDPKKIKRALSKELSGTPLDVHHPFPKREKETLRTLMLLDQDVNRKGIVREIEEARNKLIREQNILVNRPAKNRRRLEQINAQMKKFRAELRKTPYGGFLGFPVSNERGKISYIGFDKAKSLAGLREGDKMLDKDFAKASKNQITKILNTANSSLVDAVNKLPSGAQGKICNALKAGGLSTTCAEAIKQNPLKTASIVEQETARLPANVGRKALQAARLAKNVFGPLAIAGEVAFAVPFGLYDYATGANRDEIISNLTFGIGGKSQEEQLKELYGEDFGLANQAIATSERLDALDRLQQGTRGQRIRSKGKFDIAKTQFEEQTDPFIKDGVFDEEAFQENRRQEQLGLKKFGEQKAERAEQRKDTSTGLELDLGFAGGGLLKQAGDRSGKPPESGPTPDGPSEGLAFFQKNGIKIKE